MYQVVVIDSDNIRTIIDFAVLSDAREFAEAVSREGDLVESIWNCDAEMEVK